MLAAPVDQTTPDDRAGLLDCYTGDDGKKWMYVQAAATINQYDYVTIDENGTATQGTEAGSDDLHKHGVAQVAFAANEYGYVQICGPCRVNVLANCAADVELYTSATAGHLDDTSTGQNKLSGIVLTTGAGGSNEDAPAFMAVQPVVTVIA